MAAVTSGGAAHRVFADALSVFERARRGAAEHPEFCVRIAGRTICLRFAGAALEPLLAPAFSHLPRDPVGSADLTILCWDDASTGVSTKEPPEASGRGGVHFLDGPVRIAWEPERRALAGYDPSRRLALLRFADAREVVVSERSGPARRILHWWASSQGLQMAHAAAVGTAEGGVLLVGRGGSGKSTTAIACLGSQLRHAADDYCLLSLDGGLRVHALYASAKTDWRSLARLPHLRAAFDASPLRGEEESVVFLPHDFPGAMIESFPLRAVIVPRIGGALCRMAPISPAAALRAVAPSTMMQLPGDRNGTLERLADVVRAVPCFELSLSPEPQAAVPLLERLARGGEIAA
jgi:hypothetical protein